MGLPTPQQPATSPGSPAGWNPVNNQTIPDNLRQTLSTPQYQGWENGSMYQNPNNGMYQLRTNDSNNNQQVYYFDKDGKLTTAPPHD
jgi:hypothetical protein